MRINPRQVEAFHKVILTGGITSAANMMHITQPAVSRLIRDFEDALNLKLFDRDGRGLIPRAEAMKLYREVDRLYLGLDHIALIADEIRHAKGSVLRIASVQALSLLCSEQMLPALIKEYPDISLFLDIESSSHITEAITANQYDVGFIFGQASNKGLEAEPLAEASAVAVLSMTHPLAEAEQITIADLTHYRAILPGRTTPLRAQIDMSIRNEQGYLHNPIETSMANSCALAAKNVGIGVVDFITALNSSSPVIVKPFYPNIKMAYCAVYPPQIPRSQLVNQVTRMIKEKITDCLSLE
ncbi:LysR family transcriptional regulator [Brenneria goodwinii]|uniref:LysR substrate-binding domain-containing protein n=1 Tax=Brenneria goodwinii TaxID=1109412 RepID=UPI001EFB9EDA|nr:LysR substrate-binding domain-containing protein [Brenneria goodwinii]MCG8157817.1 LysR family transcriptional regulator [Brenneria goodwinii]MCG8162879.1 LysR family transcriptional regulator [Brenneria goodwinii]MCG8165101.1 LysR family transcriptional regulator [Brenneria goodwinii]MCG8171613.1 LysR family transcriptional regulator [Brenneria goodwinii]MCG8176844.1 LysR family transcriptional regulator [Brenneria goodwinii]